MLGRRSFKSDVSFLEKISMGATGTLGVLHDLRKQGHSPIELERGSTSYKIWKMIKIKRIRVPDILCIDCGKRVECRAKSTMEISMSHSKSDPMRGWDYGLDDRDFVAFLECRKSGAEPIDWRISSPVQYVSARHLRLAQSERRTVESGAKGAEEGFEVRIIWPTSVTNGSGRVVSVTKEHIQYERKIDNRLITLRLQRMGKTMTPTVKAGDSVVRSQIIASAVPVSLELPCNKQASEEHYVKLLSSNSLSDKYTSVKALAYFPSSRTTDSLLRKLSDPTEHIYIRLEAAASLARQNNKKGYDFIRQCLTDEYLQNRLESVIVLGEIREEAASRILMDVLRDATQHAEIRAAAAWALGELRDRIALDSLIESFVAMEGDIRIEAARALAKLARDFTPEILGRFPAADQTQRPGISWALSRTGRFDLESIMGLLGDEDARSWVAYIVGTQDQRKYIGEIEKLRVKDPEVYFAVTVLWKIMTSWVWGLKEY